MKHIGEIFDFHGKTLEVVEQIDCTGCFFQNNSCEDSARNFACGEFGRDDGKYVIFKQVYDIKYFKFGR